MCPPKDMVREHYRRVAGRLTFGKIGAFLSSKKRTPHFGAGFLLLRGHKQSGGGGRVIGPRLTTQFGLKTRLPKTCS